MPDQLAFDGSTHTYTKRSERIPSVTQILKAAGLVPDLSFVEPAILENARRRGVAVDLACDLYDEDDLDEDALDPAIVPYIAGYKLFRSETKYQPAASQVKIYNEAEGYAGTADSTGILYGLKTTIERKATHQFPLSAEPQVGAYAKALPGMEQVAGLHLRRDGSYRLFVFDMAAAWDIFAAALVIYRWRTRLVKAEVQQRKALE